jgi:GTP-binding protein HflX
MKTEIYEEKAVLVGVITQLQKEERAQEYINELAFLSETAGASPEKIYLQRLEYPNPNTYVGPGKRVVVIDMEIMGNQVGYAANGG